MPNELRKAIKPDQVDKRGQLGDAQNILIGLVILAMIGGVGALTLDGFQEDLTNGTVADNVTDNSLEGINNMSSQFGTVGTIGIASVLLSLVLGAFAFGRSK